MVEDYSNYPRHYYKYSSFNKQTISSFINSEFWFSNPKEFNDPYDCKIQFEYEFNEDDLREHFAKTNQFYTQIVKDISDPISQVNFIKGLYRNQIDDDSIFRIIKEIYSNNGFVYDKKLIEVRLKDFNDNPETFREGIVNVASDEIKNYKILCFSKYSTTTTMWAHYSDNHKGICIKFDSNEDKDFFSFPLKVHYVNSYPKYNYIKEWDNHGAARHIFRTKHMSWSYEEEYRIVKHKNQPNFRNGGLLKIKPDAIKAVYFGLKSITTDIELFKEINQSFYKNKIKVFKAKELPKSFKLGFERIK